MAEYSREQLLQMLDETDEQQPKTIEVRGRTIVVDEAMLRSWPVVVKLSQLSDMDGLHATVALMGIVCRCTDLDEEGVLALAGGHNADFGAVAEVLGEISQAIFPKA